MKKEYEATNYESDLTDEQWEAIKEFFPSGNKSKYHKRSLVEAVLYIVKTGCQWRMLPHDYPPHDTVWSFYLLFGFPFGIKMPPFVRFFIGIFLLYHIV